MSAIIITMAGNSSRFKAKGIDVPKYRLQVHSKSLFQWSVESLAPFLNDWRLVFVGRSDDSELRSFIASELQKMNIHHFDLISLNQPTAGQAETAALAASIVNPSEPILIYNIDTHLRAGAYEPEDFNGDGWIPTFPGAGSAWSFAELDERGYVKRVAEKVRISEHASVGLYGFGSFANFVEYLDIEKRSRDHSGELYVAPLYNHALARGAKVTISSVAASDVVPLGTPEEVKAFADAEQPSDSSQLGVHG